MVLDHGGEIDTANETNNALASNQRTYILRDVDRINDRVPRNLRASDGSYTDRIEFDWEPAPGSNVASYNVERNGTNIGDTAESFYTDDNAALVAGRRYVYSIKAVNTLGHRYFDNFVEDRGYVGSG